MSFKKEVKISNDFGVNYIEKIVELLKSHFSVSFQEMKEIEMDLIYLDYLIDGSKISFISEAMAGTSILGERDMVKRIIGIIDGSKS